MSFQFYMDVKGKSQGSIKGGSTKNSRGNASTKGILCHGFQYGVQTPLDSQSGLPTGQRQHKPIKITREVDSASPLLWHALCTSETIQSATLSFVKPDSGGKEVVFKTIELTNGVISKIEYAQPHKGARSQSITFLYEELAVDGAKNGAISPSLLG
ncbi:MAG: type VI secretion system tube protein TssD [Terracidiphilus sp.]|jgi:type VI secretion system secreted protein Hcp